MSVQYNKHDVVSTGPTFGSIALDAAARSATVTFTAGKVRAFDSNFI
jgi:hypothetical protein